MPIKFYSWLKKAALVTPVLLLAISLQTQAQSCQWLPYAPYIAQPAFKFYENQLSPTSGNVYIAQCSTDKGLVNFNNTSTYPAFSDTNNYNYFPGNLCKANAGSKVDLYVRTAYILPANNTSTPQFHAFIDWNHNGFFEETPTYTEHLTWTSVNTTAALPNGTLISAGGTGTGNNMARFTFEVPKHAKNGPTRMRVRLGALSAPPQLSGGFVFACSQSKYGEAEDYDFEVVNPCLPPSVISVSSISCNGAEICWSTVNNADGYDYWVDTCKVPGCSFPLPPNGSGPPVNPGPDTVRFTNLSGLTCRTIPNNDYASILPETKYYVTVRATCDTIQKPNYIYWQNSTWVTDSFTTLACCREPLNVNVAEVLSTTAKASWDPVHTAFMYEYAVTTTPNNPPATGTKISSTSVLLQGLTHSKTYYFCVRALCSPTPRSGWVCFPFATGNTTSITGIDLNAPMLSAYPNPVKNIVTISIDNFNNNKGMLTISDIAGRVVYTADMNTDKMDINMSAWAQGLYLVKYTSDNGSKTIKITKD